MFDVSRYADKTAFPIDIATATRRNFEGALRGRESRFRLRDIQEYICGDTHLAHQAQPETTMRLFTRPGYFFLLYLISALSVARIQSARLVQVGLARRRVQTGVTTLAEISDLFVHWRSLRTLVNMKATVSMVIIFENKATNNEHCHRRDE